MAPVNINCVLTITPGTDTTQAKIRLAVGDVVVFDDYESNLADGERFVAGEITEAHGKAMGKLAMSLRRKNG